MKVIYVALIGIMITSGSMSCSAQRDVNTSSARAAYAPPSSNPWHYKKKSRKKKSKPVKARKTRARDTDAARERRRGISGF